MKPAPSADRQKQLINLVRHGVECDKDLLIIDDWIDCFNDNTMTYDEYDWCRKHLNVHYKVFVGLK